MLNYIKFFVYTSTLFFCSFGFGQSFIIDFDDAGNWTVGSGGITSYQTDHEYNDQNWLFTGGPALRNGTGAQDGFPGALGTYSWRLRNAPATWSGTYNDAGDIVSFGFDVRRWDGSPNPNWDIAYSINGGGTWTNVGTINNAFLSNSSDWISFSYTLPSVTSVTIGDFVVQLSRNGGERIMIDNFTWTEDSPTNTINTSTVSPLSYTVDCTTGQNGDVDFTSSGVFNAGNNFIAQLSDETGNFANPVNIGSLTLAGSNPSGNISFTIPLATISGTGYRIRVISDDPNAIGSDNGVDITVSLSGGPCVLEPPHMTSLIINSCNSSCSEGNNELVFGFTGDYSVLMNSANLELTYGNSPSPTTVYTNPLVNNSGTTDDLNSEAGCAGLFVDATNTVIPPNSSFMLAHDEFCPGDVLDFANFCGSGPIYVVYTQDPSWSLSGNFVNDPGCSGGTRYLTTSIVSTDGSSHIIDYEFDCTLNTGSNGDYAKWDANGGIAIEQGNNGCELDPIVLPIELLELKVYKKKDEVEIKWSTLSERSNDYFILSHSTDGLNFFTISTIDGAGTSTNTNYYSDIHLYPKEGINYYRLQSVDYDGTTYLKGIRVVEFNSENIYYDNSSRMIYTNSKGDYNVVNLAGQIIIKGRDTDKIPFSNTGIYIIQNLKTGETNKLAIH